MSGEGKLRSDWNQALLSDVVAPLYIDLLEGLTHAKDRLPLPQYYGLFPDPNATLK
jgi:hypothetical protein